MRPELLVATVFLLAGCTGPATTPTISSPPPPSQLDPHSWIFSTDHPQGNMTFEVGIEGLPEGESCLLREAYTRWASPPIASWTQQKGRPGGGYYSERDAHAHVASLGIDTRQPWDHGRPVNVTSENPLKGNGAFIIARGGLVPDTPFQIAVRCPAPAIPTLVAAGHEFAVVRQDSMEGGAGFTLSFFATGIPYAEGAANALDHHEATFGSERLWLHLIGGYGNQYGLLELSGAIERSFLIDPDFWEEVEGPGGRLRFDLSGGSDAPHFLAVVVGLDPLPAPA